MLTTTEFILAVKRRAVIVRQKHEKRKKKLAILLSAVLTVCMTAAALAVPGGFTRYAAVNAGGFNPSDADIGGYVLVGVISFVSGVAVTLLTKSWLAVFREDASQKIY